MQFLLIAYDGKDPEALERRLKIREKHLGNVRKLKQEKEFLVGGAILDEAGKMIGSMIVYDFPDRESLDDMLKDEPYITGGVWKEIKIQPFRLAGIE